MTLGPILPNQKFRVPLFMRAGHARSAAFGSLRLGKELEEEGIGRAAFLTRTIARNAEFGFCLSHSRPLRSQVRTNRLDDRRNKSPPMNRKGGSSLLVRALLARRLKLRIAADDLLTLRRGHFAMMLSIAAATRGQTSLVCGIPCQKRLDEWLA
jgi:hypothetical protein